MFTLPNLNYAKNALDPAMSVETLDLHHSKHHQTYVTNLNNLIKGTTLENESLENIIKKTANDPSKAGIFNNAGQHYNHILFWQCMRPSGGGKMPGKLEKKIIETFGTVEKFKEDFIQAGVTQFGSGWAWLSLKGDQLVISKTANGSNP
ncbi:MAG: superoxide dismutase, partial [Candidatus Fonsibacter ubiquis]